MMTKTTYLPNASQREKVMLAEIERLKQIENDYWELIHAARDAVEHWSAGDLAAAINRLDGLTRD